MIVMPSDNSGVQVGFLAGKYPGRIGHLYCDRTKGPWDFLPYAIDNGAYGAWARKRPWDAPRFIDFLDHYRLRRPSPLWILAPDVVTDREATIAKWHEWEPRLRGYGVPLAFAAQDGMTAADVPASADVVFVGGSTDWKWSHVEYWCHNFTRVHVGRVNHYWGLRRCHDAGAESCDGTGWIRGDQRQLARLLRYLAEAAGERVDEQGVLAI